MNDRPPPSPARIATLVALPVALLAGLIAFWLLGGFTGSGARPRPTATARAQPTAPVAMPAPSLDPRAATVCRALLARLPDALQELPRRQVTEGPEQNAAYGDPAITLACGVAPRSVESTATVYHFGICWYADEQPDRTVWTTLDREVPVQVIVPGSYQAPGQRVAAFTDPLVASVPSATSIPSGC